MTTIMKKMKNATKFILIPTFSCFMLGNALATDFRVTQGDGICPSDYVLAAPSDVRANQKQACETLGMWYIARLAGGGSMDGRGYQCQIRDKDDRKLGHSLCKKANSTLPQNKCYWTDWKSKWELETQLACKKGTSMREIAFQHKMHQNGTHQESYRLSCCRDSITSRCDWLDWQSKWALDTKQEAQAVMTGIGFKHKMHQNGTHQESFKTKFCEPRTAKTLTNCQWTKPVSRPELEKTFSCDSEKQRINGINFSHKTHENATYQERVSLQCCNYKSSIKELVVNGSFEQPKLGSGWKSFKSIPGWIAKQGDIEIQHGVAGTPQHRKQLVELDAHNSSAIYQDINTQTGKAYRIIFFFSARPGTAAGDNKLQVSWGDRVIDTIDAGAGGKDTVWKKYTYAVGACRDKTQLEFKDVGKSNSLGSYIDHVSVKLIK